MFLWPVLEGFIAQDFSGGVVADDFVPLTRGGGEDAVSGREDDGFGVFDGLDLWAVMLVLSDIQQIVAY